MKKIIQLFILVLVVNTSYAQVIFEQDFESGSIAPMTMVDVDGNTPHPNVNLLTEAWNVLNGTESLAALSTSWFASPATADDWLITPQMNINDAEIAINWQARTYDSNFPDGYEVRVSITDNDPASFTDIIWSTAAEQSTADLASRSASLAAYVGMDIYIAFRNNSNDAYILEIDNIVVKKLQTRDVKIVSFNSKRFHEAGATVPISITIENNGAEMLTSVDFTWTDGTNTYTDNLSGLSLVTGATMDLTSTTSASLATGGTFYPATISLTNPNGDVDLAPDDNMFIGKLGTVETKLNRKIVVEEGTGTWCGWCPRGAVGLEAMAAKYPDNFIGIAVHNGDPMTVAEYNGPLGISAFPGSKVNRSEEDIDPSETSLDGQILVRREEITPATATVIALGDKLTRTIAISASALFTTPLSGDDFRFAAVIIENGVTGTDSGYDQVNFYAGGGQGVMGGYETLPDPVPAADMVYEHVGRAILGGFDGEMGSVPADVALGDSPSFDFMYTVPAEFDMDELHVAVLLIDNATGEIYNADETKVEFAVGTSEIVDESISRIHPNPVSDVAYIDINLQESAEVTLQVVDMMGKTISNQNLGTLFGTNKMTYDVSNLNTGIYMFRITAGDLVSTKKITVVK